MKIKQRNLVAELTSRMLYGRVTSSGIMAEEAGEAVQAANDAVHGGASLEPLRKELEQTAAMCIRCLIHLDAKA